MAQKPYRWPHALTLLLVELWPTGLSTSKIAERLSAHPAADRVFSKNSVVGAMTRLVALDYGLARRPCPNQIRQRAEKFIVAMAQVEPTEAPTLVAAVPQAEPASPVDTVVPDTEPEGDVMVESAPSVVVEVPSPVPVPAPAQLAEPPAFRCSPPAKVTPIKRLTCQYPHGHPREPGFHFCGAPVWACEDPTGYNPEHSTVYCYEHEKLCHQPTPMRRAA